MAIIARKSSVNSLSQLTWLSRTISCKPLKDSLEPFSVSVVNNKSFNICFVTAIALIPSGHKLHYYSEHGKTTQNVPSNDEENASTGAKLFGVHHSSNVYRRLPRSRSCSLQTLSLQSFSPSKTILLGTKKSHRNRCINDSTACM